MTVKQFDNKKFAPLDIVNVIMKDGKVRREFLYQGKAYKGHPAIKKPDRKVIHSAPAQILVLGDFIYGTGGISLVDVRDVTLVARMP